MVVEQGLDLGHVARQVGRQLRIHERARRIPDHPAKRGTGGFQGTRGRLPVADAAGVAGLGLGDIGLGQLTEAIAPLHAVELGQEAAFIGECQLQDALVAEHQGEGLDRLQEDRLLDCLERCPLGPDQLLGPVDAGARLAARVERLLEPERVPDRAQALRAAIGLGLRQDHARADRGSRPAGRPGDRQPLVDRAQPCPGGLERRVLLVDLAERRRQGDLGPGRRGGAAEAGGEQQGWKRGLITHAPGASMN